MADIVKMKRLEPQFPGGPVDAEVHPDEVESMKACDWYVDGEQTEDTKPAKGKKSAEAEPTG
jgi:hypothetical protein